MTGRLVDAQVFVRVSEPGAESWSVPTKAWVTTEDCETNTCGTPQYLDEKSDDPSDWTCTLTTGEGVRQYGSKDQPSRAGKYCVTLMVYYSTFGA